MKSVLRLIMYLIYYLIARHLPISYRPYACGAKLFRYLCCKVLFARCGKSVNIEHGADFASGRSIEIGNYSGIGIHSKISHVKIGDYVMMGQDVCVFPNNHKSDDIVKPMALQGYTDVKSVTIENDVWIGARAIILTGITIGKGAIIAAGAVVTKDVPPLAVVAGNPAQVVRYRNMSI